MYQVHGTIKETLDAIQRRDLVLPAIQREFVWRPGQICRLFDSLMQGYPFGAFLYWRVQPETSGNFRFFDFVLNYHQRDNPHCPPLPPLHDRQLTAVLDGQQRLTALNIGLRGSMAWKRPRMWWNNPDAFPVRQLHLDVLWEPDNDDEELRYRFEFLTRGRSEAARDGECWFPVGTVLGMDGGPDMMEWVTERLPKEQMVPAYKTLDKLYRVVHTENTVAFYEEKSQKLDKVLQIFIRTNSGGTFLSHSDLLLSIAVSQWSEKDAREEIHTLVDDLNRIGTGFTLSKDWVLKAGLMLSDIGSVAFKVDNFNRGNMATLEEKWDDIKHSLTLTVQLVSSFGFSGQNLRANNAILPIAYYLYKKKYEENYLTRNEFKQDREVIREWLIRSLLKSGVWGGGLDTLLTAIRSVIGENGDGGFPASSIQEEMARRGRSLVFEDEEVKDLVDMEFKGRLTFALLSLLFPFVDLRNRFHVDHVFPRSRFTESRLRSAGVPDDEIGSFMGKRDRLANLQLLQGAENLEKHDKMPADWLDQVYPGNPTHRGQYENDHLLGDVPDEMTEFRVFYEARRTRLKEEITRLLGRRAI